MRFVVVGDAFIHQIFLLVTFPIQVCVIAVIFLLFCFRVRL